MNNFFVCEHNGMMLVEAEALYEMCKAYESHFTQTLSAEMGKTIMTFHWERYTMNGMGYHIGYEHWKVKIPLIKKCALGWLGSPRCVWGDYVAALNSDMATVVLVDHPSVERGEEGYYPPEKDMGWEDFQCMIDPIIRELKCGEPSFNNEDRSWSIKTSEREIIMGDLEHNQEANRDRRYVKK